MNGFLVRCELATADEPTHQRASQKLAIRRQFVAAYPPSTTRRSSFPQFLLAAFLLCAQAAPPASDFGRELPQHAALIVSDGSLAAARAVANHLVPLNHFVTVCSRHKGGTHQCHHITSSSSDGARTPAAASLVEVGDLPRLPGMLVYVYGRHHTDHVPRENSEGGLGFGGGGGAGRGGGKAEQVGIHGGAALGRRLQDVFAGAHRTATPTALVRADSITGQMLDELGKMVAMSAMIPTIDAISPQHSDAVWGTVDIDVFPAQPPLATRLPNGWSDSRAPEGQTGRDGANTSTKAAAAAPKHSVAEKLTAAIHLLRSVANDPREAAVLDTLVVNVATRQKDDPARAMLLGDGSMAVHDAIKHYTELHNVSMFNMRRTVPDTDSAALVFCEKCKGTGVEPCDAGEWGTNRVRWLMMFNRMYKTHKIDKQQLDKEKRLPDCGAVSEVVLHIRATGEVRFLKQPIGNAECGLGHGFAARPQPQGYEDPRLFSWIGEPYVLINGCRKGRRNMFLHDVRRNLTVRLWLDAAGNAQNAYDGDQTEKNWTPYEDGGKLRFVYSFGQTHALGVVELVDKVTGACRVVHGSATYDSDFDVAGSTQLVQWNYPFLVGYAHTRHGPQPSTLPKKQDKRTKKYQEVRYKYVYRAVPVVLNAITFAVWYGDAVAFDAPPHPFAKPSEGIFKDVQFPFDLQLRGDHVQVGIEFQDRCPTWVKMALSDFGAGLPLPPPA